MSDLMLLSRPQVRRIEPFFPRPHDLPRVDDRRVVSGIIYVIRYGLQWKDAPRGYGPPKTLYHRSIRWSLLGVFARIFAALAAEADAPEQLMIDTTISKLTAPRPVCSKRGCSALHWTDQRRPEFQAARRLRWAGAARAAAPHRRPGERPQGRRALDWHTKKIR